MNTKLFMLQGGEFGTPETTALINELVSIAQRQGHVKVANKTGGALTKGTLVQISGYDATLAAPTVVTAQNTSGAWRLADLVLSEDISNNKAGIAYGAGIVTGIDTSGASAVGDKVYLSTAGAFVFSAPGGAGTAVQTVGVVTAKSNTAGAVNFFPCTHVVAAAATGDIADDAITLAKLEDGTAGQLIMCDAGGEPAFKTMSGDATIDGTGALALTGIQVKKLTQAIAYDDFTDDSGASGHLDITDKIPAGSLVLGWLFDCTTGFTGDTSAVMEAGISGTVDKYSAVTNGSVFASGLIGSICKTTATVLELAQRTVRVTVTSASDFSSVAAGAGTFTILYI